MPDQPLPPSPAPRVDAPAAALERAPKPSMQTGEFWLLALIVGAIQGQVAAGKFNAATGNALCTLAGLGFTALRIWLKTHHTSQLADVAIAALDAAAVAAPANSTNQIPNSNPPTPMNPQSNSPAVQQSTAARTYPATLACLILASFALALAPLVFLGGCETGADGKKQLTPRGKQVLQVVGDVVLNAAINAASSAASQYLSDGQVDGGKLAAASISGAALGLRSLESTPQAASPQAIANTLSQATDNPAIARSITPVILNGVQTAMQSGVPPSVAVEHAAVQLDAAAAASAAANAKSQNPNSSATQP